MKNEWLSIQSFQQSQDLIDAINTLSIHIKFQLMDKDDDEKEQDIEEAKEKLTVFLEEIEKTLHQVTDVETEPLTGINPRFRELVRNFASAKNDRNQFKSGLFREPLSAIVKLLDSNKSEDQKALLESLAELRILLEEHIHIDTMRIIGDI